VDGVGERETRFVLKGIEETDGPSGVELVIGVLEELPSWNPRKFVQQLDEFRKLRRALDLFPAGMRLVQGLVEGFFVF